MRTECIRIGHPAMKGTSHESATKETCQLVTLLGRLVQLLGAELHLVLALKPWLNGAILLVEQIHVL